LGNWLKIGVLVAICLIPLFTVPVFAENESLKIAARSYEQIPIHLNQGDELEYTISVSGGSNDDINLTIFYPGGGDDGGGRVYGQFDDTFVAPKSGVFVFSFDNTFSLLTNKQVNFSYSITKNTYYVYVDKIPAEGKDNAVKAVVKASEYWKQIYPKKQFYEADSESQADIIVKWVKDYGRQKHVGFKFQELVQVGLGDSLCGGNWHPFSSYTVEGIMIHEIGHAIGLEHSKNPADIMYSITETYYGLIEKEFTITERHAQFVSLCVAKQITSIDYSITTDDPTFGFDVYSVPSSESITQWVEQGTFYHYPNKSCFGEGYLSFVGTCDGISNTAGLLIIMGKETTKPLTKINVAIQERLYNGGPQSTALIANIYDAEPTSEETQGSPEPSFETQSKSNKISCGEGTIKNEKGQCIPISQTKGGGCLIATAIFGSELSPQVQMLREIRDNSLLQTQSGQSFMQGFNEFYYSFSPAVADYERQNPVFKEAVKVTITPLLASLSLLNYVDLDSEESVLGYGIGIILMNIGMYFVAPAIIISKIRRIM